MTPRPVLNALVLAGALLAIAAVAVYATTSHQVGPHFAARATQVTIGLVLAAYCNFMPKRLSPWWDATEASGRAQRALRVSGWAFTLAGLAYAAAGAVAPPPIAEQLGMAVVAAAMVLTAGYAVWACGGYRNSRIAQKR